ncbi:Rabankyrin-5 [Frankliniella fusca]|uniref:Rabankyrin-5 n=1 Tax=Frankliniella fusca TaxID=407009 RepID=A0AAE1LH29_9NEOP|nr:Rabankyrin-5 [Frankliniella fusca]
MGCRKFTTFFLSSLLNSVDGRGDLPLDLALRDQQTSLAKTLVEHGADLNAQDARGWTLLHCAVERGDSFAATFLLEKGAGAALRTPGKGDTALHMVAALSPDTTDGRTLAALTEVAAVMLSGGLDPNLQNKQGYAPLHLAVKSRNAQVFSLLLQRPNIDLNVRTEPGHGALYYALLAEGEGPFGEDSFAARLVKQGANANPVYPAMGDSLIHIMAREDLEEQGLFLAEHANNVNHVNAQGQTAMHVACERGLAKLVAALLNAGGNPNLQTLTASDAGGAHRQTPLHVAIANRNEDAAHVIIDYRLNYQCQKGNPKAVPIPNLDVKDSAGDTPLSLAIRSGMQSTTENMLKAGADVNVRNGKGLTLLHQAILNKDSKMANFLLNCGADMNALTSDNETPLELCIQCRLPDVVESLCTRGVDMSIPDKDGCCPLWAALASDQEDIASILVRNGADTDCWGAGPDGCLQSLLHKAIDENQESIANFLIRSGCDLNAPRRQGPNGAGGDEAHDLQGPLHMCCSWGLQSTVQTLVEHGANVNAKDAEGHTPLHIAIQNQHSSIIALLLCHPSIDLSIRDKTGLSPFASALTVRNHKAAEAILDKMPNAAEQTDNKGRNFLHTAIQRNDSESVLFLLSINVDVNSRVNDANQTPPLHLAAVTGNDVLVRSLFLAGARPNDVDAHKRNALHVASEAGHANIVSACLSNGVAYDAVDSAGDSALHIACREGHLQVVRTLLEESQLNAETMNLKGQNPLHVLARHGKDNSSAICELFLEFMPDYPINKADLDGNTALMLAYMKGNGNLCRALVKAKACIGSMNKDGVTIFNYQVTTKQLLYSLLNHLSEEPPWAEGDLCLDCGTKFGFTVRKHHCRHCGRVLCSSCSGQDVPILKFNQKKPVRVCSVCFDFLQVGSS